MALENLGKYLWGFISSMGSSSCGHLDETQNILCLASSVVLHVLQRKRKKKFRPRGFWGNSLNPMCSLICSGGVLHVFRKKKKNFDPSGEPISPLISSGG